MIEVAKPSREQFIEQAKLSYQESIEVWKQYYNSKQDCDWLDEDGYPTDDALNLIEQWHWIDSKGWFEFIKSIWNLSSWGWTEKDEPHDFMENKMVHRYHISTGGWSGNESIVRAMEFNEMMWHLNWVQSRRGGHYIFELREFKDEGNNE